MPKRKVDLNQFVMIFNGVEWNSGW